MRESKRRSESKRAKPHICKIDGKWQCFMAGNFRVNPFSRTPEQKEFSYLALCWCLGRNKEDSNDAAKLKTNIGA